MTIDELRLEIDVALQEAVGMEAWGQLNVWIEYRSMRLAEPKWELPMYKIEVHHQGDSLQVRRPTVDDVLFEFRRYILPRLVSRFGATEWKAVVA